MIKEFIDKWDKYKKDLQKYFETTAQEEYCEYEKIVWLLFDKVINRNMKYGKYDTQNILIIDDGDYQGTQIFILHRDTYQPSAKDYVYTIVDYGSCSCCDTLQAIYSWGLPTQQQVKDYMQLALNLLQQCHYMIDTD